MSCKYCEEYADINPTITDVNMAKYCLYIAHFISLNGKRSAGLVFTDGNDEWESVISFCPMCGEDLRNGGAE